MTRDDEKPRRKRWIIAVATGRVDPNKTPRKTR